MACCKTIVTPSQCGGVLYRAIKFNCNLNPNLNQTGLKAVFGGLSISQKPHNELEVHDVVSENLEPF